MSDVSYSFGNKVECTNEFAPARNSMVSNSQRVLKSAKLAVIGQDTAVQTVAVAIDQHLRRLEFSLNNNGKTLPGKSNVLLMGPTGCGKTHLVKTMARAAGVPFLELNATDYSPAGYKGADVEEIPAKAYLRAKETFAEPGTSVAEIQEYARWAIVFIDEVDKLATFNGEAISGKDVQNALLKVVEGVSSSCGVATDNMLFIFAGSFAGLEKVVQRRLERDGSVASKSIGFTNSVQGDELSADDLMARATTDDLVNFGMVPEFLGRMPLKAAVRSLDVEDFRRILQTTSADTLGHAETLYGIKVRFSDEAVEFLANQAKARGTGARGLKEAVNTALQEVFFNLVGTYDDTHYRVTVDDGRLTAVAETPLAAVASAICAAEGIAA